MNTDQSVTEEEVQCLRAALRRNSVIQQILGRLPRLQMPNCVLGAGCIAQTVWNELHGYKPNSSIQDYDLAYFDSTDFSEEGEEKYILQARSILGDLGATIDIKNEARVHLWYKNHFGVAIRPYSSIEDAIGSWPTTATSIEVRYEENGDLTVIAPFGLADLFSMTVRPNKKQLEYFLRGGESTSRDVYEKKAAKWAKVWPKLVVIPWES